MKQQDQDDFLLNKMGLTKFLRYHYTNGPLMRALLYTGKKMTILKTEVRLYNEKTNAMLTFSDCGDGDMVVIVTNNHQSSAAHFPLKDIFDFISKVYDIELTKEEDEDDESSAS
jgi:hypothetical protein